MGIFRHGFPVRELCAMHRARDGSPGMARRHCRAVGPVAHLVRARTMRQQQADQGQPDACDPVGARDGGVGLGSPAGVLAPDAAGGQPGVGGPSTLTARATTRATVTSDTSDSNSIASLAQRASGSVSVGLNAVEFVKAR